MLSGRISQGKWLPLLENAEFGATWKNEYSPINIGRFTKLKAVWRNGGITSTCLHDSFDNWKKISSDDITASSQITDPNRAFDSDLSTEWRSTSVSGQWIQTKFVSKRRVAKYTLSAYSTYLTNMPTSWVLEATDDRNSRIWTKIDEQFSVSWTSNEVKEYVVNSRRAGLFLFYRLRFTHEKVVELRIWEINYFATRWNAHGFPSCDVPTNGIWKPFWWFTSSTWPSDVSNVLGKAYDGTCKPTDEICFQRLPDFLEEDCLHLHVHSVYLELLFQ